ncbi:MAG: hypothetical protein K1X29_09535 [Bdellovibrionales bacterium]|nr:hypothetical protein [Bdellovibrionales bacterium]
MNLRGNFLKKFAGVAIQTLAFSALMFALLRDTSVGQVKLIPLTQQIKPIKNRLNMNLPIQLRCDSPMLQTVFIHHYR